MARPRAFQPIDTIPMVGGRACLDFVNTTGNRGGRESRERLVSYRDLLVFGRRSGLLGDDAARVAARRSKPTANEAERALRRAIELRELLYRLFLCASNRTSPSDADLRRFNQEHEAVARRRKLAWSSTAPAWELDVAPDEVEAMRWRLVASAAELLSSPDLAQLRKCGDCDWLFLDTSKNRMRRWCKKSCGDRVKARSYYRRLRGDRRSRGAKHGR